MYRSPRTMTYRKLPHGSEALLIGSEALLAGSEALPAYYEGLPAGSEALPTGSKYQLFQGRSRALGPFSTPPWSKRLFSSPLAFTHVICAFYACICIKILRFFSLYLFNSLCCPLPLFFTAGLSFCWKKLYFYSCLNDFS